MARRFRVSVTRQINDNVSKADGLAKRTRAKRKPKTSTPAPEVCWSTVKAMEKFMTTETNAVPEMWLAAVPDEYLSAYDRYPDDWTVFEQANVTSKKY